eukprot:1157567-Pelagomonas_calceolata.AAC.2
MQLVYRGFDQRRKMLRNSLQPAYTPVEVREHKMVRNTNMRCSATAVLQPAYMPAKTSACKKLRKNNCCVCIRCRCLPLMMVHNNDSAHTTDANECTNMMLRTGECISGTAKRLGRHLRASKDSSGLRVSVFKPVHQQRLGCGCTRAQAYTPAEDA